MDIEFTQKLQNIMGKGSQSPAVNTPTSIINKNEADVDTLSQQAIPNSSGGNSRFSVSPVSENKNMNSSVGGNYYWLNTLTLLIKLDFYYCDVIQ